MRPVSRALVAGVIAASAACNAACTDPAVTLPDDWNTLHHRAINVDIFTRPSGPTGVIRPLQGMTGAPLARAADLADLTLSYWDRPNDSDDPDGAHVDVVRVVPTGSDACGLALDGIYHGGEAIPASYDFAQLDRHAASVEGVRGDGLVMVLDVSGRGACGDHGTDAVDPFDDALARPDTWAEAAASVVRHLAGDASWERNAHAYPIVGAQPFRIGDVAHEAAAFTLFAKAARRIRAVEPDVPIVSPEIAVASAADAAAGAQSALSRFLDRVAEGDAPLDVVALAIRGGPIEAEATVTAVVAALADRGFAADVAVTSYALPALDLPYAADSGLGLAHLGASEMAARLRFEALPVRWFFSGFGPWLPLGNDAAAFAETAYFERDGTPTPAYVLREPMRQIEGDQRVVATTDFGDELTVLATFKEGRVSIVIAHPATATGVGSITYTLTVPAFTLPTFPNVAYRLAELDQSNRGTASFFFSDLGVLDVNRKTGDVRMVRTLPVPGVHFIEIDQPAP